MKKILKKIIVAEKPDEPKQEIQEELTLHDELLLLEAEIAEAQDDIDDPEDTEENDEESEEGSDEGTGAISPLKAIRKNCIQCIGSIREIPKCTASKSCPLYPFRMGTNPFRQKRVLSEEQREAARLRLQHARENKGKG